MTTTKITSTIRTADGTRMAGVYLTSGEFAEILEGLEAVADLSAYDDLTPLMNKLHDARRVLDAAR